MEQGRRWAEACPDRIRKQINAVTKSHMPIEQLNDPTRFAVRDAQGKSYHCTIGNPHLCSCIAMQPCGHILSVLLLFFEVSSENPIVWQSYINEVELIDLIEKKTGKEKCTLCRERTGSMSSCEKCSARFHQLCLKLASKSGKGSCSTCPKCSEELPRCEGNDKVCCSNCNANCKSENYTCLLCPDYNLCRCCYESAKAHPSHPFGCSKVGGRFLSTAGVTPHNVGDLQYREIDPEDYEALLALDKGGGQPLGKEDLRNLPTEYFGARRRKNNSCPVCLCAFLASSRCIALTCGHIMHQRCGFKWLSEFSDTCPVDKQKAGRWSTIQDARPVGEVRASSQASRHGEMTLQMPSTVPSFRLPDIKTRERK
ncbi:hypothetical protein LSCM1_07227 [Leishmania martiniquensis]|uniref:RING-type domain-containing protein n=1 Tax=Leishmania martiniquensis TaxID=1580590 RepID=A0A836H6R6_9TRYP|nr:hypothetical protein LSCM1_07227 [Leishmania martiniquensis]